jgi:3-ketosteroid 9alpha-monooxygenase subunit B
VSTDNHYELKVADVISETADAVSVLFTVPSGAEREFAYKPGQFLTLQLPGPDGPIARCYSLCSSPDTDDGLRIAVKRVTSGLGSNWICDNLKPGDAVTVLPPAGVFTPKTWDEDLLLFAGGSGITPVLSILKSALAIGSGKVTLVYANQHEKAVIFAAELRALAEKYPDRLHVIHWLESVQGLPNRTQLAAFAAPYVSYTSFICGPSPFMDSVSHCLRELGVPPARIHVEKFLSLADNPFEIETPPLADDSAGTAELEVLLDGETHTLAWPKQMKLLDFLLDKGIKAPFSCRQGACSACACIVDEGEVKMLVNDILEEDDLADGFVLGCQSLPVSDVVKVRYDG